MSQNWVWHANEFEVGASVPKGIAFKSDPLALILWMKSNKKNNYDISQELGKLSEMHVTDDLARKALDIRKYYRNKLVMLALKGTEFSDYRQALRKFVDTDNIYYIREDFIPLATKLPDFYKEDLTYDRLKSSYVVNQETYYKKYHNNETVELTPVECVSRKSRSANVLNYYFADDKKRLYKIWIAPNNPCLHLFEREFAKDKVTIKGHFSGEKITGNEIYLYGFTAWEIQ